MPHINAPLTPTGRLRMVRRHLEDGIPKAHVAAEFRVSRPTVATWVARYLAAGEAGLADRPSVPRHSPQRTPAAVVELIESLRRDRKWSARRIHRHLLDLGHELHLRTVGRWLARLGISRLRDLTPAGDDLRRPPQRIRAAWPGHMVHLDVKKVGRIPDGGGWRAHGRGSTAAKAAKRGPGAKVGYTYLHSAVDGFSRLAYTEALADEKAVTTIGFFCRARAFFYYPRDREDPPSRHGQRRQLQGPRLHPVRGGPRRPAPAHPPLHAPAQRQGRAVQPTAGRRGSLRPPLFQ